MRAWIGSNTQRTSERKARIGSKGGLEELGVRAISGEGEIDACCNVKCGIYELGCGKHQEHTGTVEFI